MFLFQVEKQVATVSLNKLNEVRSNLGDPPTLFYKQLDKYGKLDENLINSQLSLPLNDPKRVVVSYDKEKGTITLDLDRLKSVFDAAYPNGLPGSMNNSYWTGASVVEFIKYGIVPREAKPASGGQRSGFMQ